MLVMVTEIVGYYNALERVNRFTLGLNTAKNIDYIENVLIKNDSESNFPQKT